MGLFDFLRKATPRSGGRRLPFPKTGVGYGVDYSNGQFTFRDLLTFGGRALPIQPADAGDPLLNPIVAACLQWICTSWMVALPQVGVMDGSQFTADKKPHPLLDLLRQPNPDYGGRWLFWALCTDWWIYGNAYAHIIPSSSGIQELNWVSARRVKPVPDMDGYLAHYLWEADGRKIEVDPEEILHFRYGINPSNPLLGWSPIAAGFREIVADNSASDYAAGLLQNGAVPPWILSPKMNKDGVATTIPESALQEITNKLKELIRQKPGEGRMLPGAVELIQLAFEPGQLGLELIREEPETRIPALFGIPPVVVGLRAGMLRSTYNNVSEARKQAWESCLIPAQDYFAEEMGRRLLPYYKGSAGKVVAWDRSRVLELQEDINAKREAARADFMAGIITLDEVRAESGLETTPAVAAQLVKPKLSEQKRLSLKKVPAETDLYAALDRVRGALKRREAEALRRMRKAWSGVRSSILARIEALEEAMDASQQPVDRDWLYNQRRYHELLDQVEDALREVASDQGEVIAAAQDAVVTLAADHCYDLAVVAVGPPPAGESLPWSRLQRDAVEALVGFASDGSPLADLLEEIAPETQDLVRQVLLTGVAEGKAPREIAKELEAVTDASQHRAETIARTEVMRAHREATRQHYEENSDVLDGWIWMASIGTATETCAGCWAMHGTVHPSSEILDDHPNGRCVMAPRTRSWGEILGDDTIPDTRPTVESGEDAFAKLTPDQQREILGSGAYELWRVGKISLSDMVVQTHNDRWGSMRRAASLSEALERARG